MTEELVTYFKETYYESPVGTIAIVTMDNGQDYKKPNTFGEGAMKSLHECMDRIEKRKDDIKALVLTGKVFIFAVGADLNKVPEVTNAEIAKENGKAGHDAFKRIMDLPFITVAAINGAAMGGGLEISLFCDYRTVSDSVPAIAFPECFLGLIPGWGGTTLTPKLIGPEKALQLIVYNPLNNNRMIKAKDAFDLGLADRIYESADFIDKSIQFAVDLVAGNEKVERPSIEWDNIDGLCDAAKSFVDSKVHGAAPAPYAAVEIIRKLKNMTVDEGLKAEEEALGELIPGYQCQASVYSFDLVQRRSKKPIGVPEVDPLPVNKVGIIGAGLMGSQLASLFLQKLKKPVVVKDINQEVLDRSMIYIQGDLEKRVKKGRLDEGMARYLMSLVKPTLEYGDFSDCDFILEAVLEEMSLKKKIFADVEEHVSETALLATNTSSLSITEMASDLKNPERVVGFHFFNPVAVLPLLEIINGEQTNDITLKTAFEVGKTLRKKCVKVKDAPAFLVNRLLIRNSVTCIDLVDEGNDFPEVDEALLALGLPMAPFDLIALVGPAVGLHATETLAKAFPDRYHTSKNMEKLVEMKKPGVYSFVPEGKVVDPEVKAFWKQQDPPKKSSPQEMRDRVLENMADECWRCLDEGVIAEPEDIDTCLLLGAGYPFFMGGATMYLDQKGYSEKVKGKKFHG